MVYVTWVGTPIAFRNVSQAPPGNRCTLQHRVSLPFNNFYKCDFQISCPSLGLSITSDCRSGVSEVGDTIKEVVATATYRYNYMGFLNTPERPLTD